jgi:hypothetical protein
MYVYIVKNQTVFRALVILDSGFVEAIFIHQTTIYSLNVGKLDFFRYRLTCALGAMAGIASGTPDDMF